MNIVAWLLSFRILSRPRRPDHPEEVLRLLNMDDIPSAPISAISSATTDTEVAPNGFPGGGNRTTRNAIDIKPEIVTAMRYREPPRLNLITNLSTSDCQDSPDSDGDVLDVLDHSPEVVDDAAATGHRFIPFVHIFDFKRFSELMPDAFIRDRLVNLKVIEMEPLPSTLNIFNQYLFTIVIHHGSAHWTIKRKTKHIVSLHNQLRIFKAKLKLPAATSGERERRQSMRNQMKSCRHKISNEDSSRSAEKGKKLVKLPRKALQRMETNSMKDVEMYLGNLLQHSLLRNHCAVLEFLEISPFSFIGEIGPKLKEGFVKKRSGGTSNFACCGGRYKTRWLILRESFMFLISPGKGSIRTVMLIDAGFQVSHGFRHTGVPKGLRITNLTRSLVLRCDGEECENEWSSAIEHIRDNYAADFSKPNRHLSFAPVRRKSFARWYVDGSHYMFDVANLLESAKEEIFITDWWLSPDIYLKRPDLTGKQWKLSEILDRQAARGVKIFILLYKEVELALGLNSFYSKRALGQLSSNIKILRHPDHYNTGTLYWAHHEKMVIVDQMHAFVGGIDLCYGRWDDYRHKLVDVGHGGFVTKKQSGGGGLALSHLIQNTRDIFVRKISDSIPRDFCDSEGKHGSNPEIMTSVGIESRGLKDVGYNIDTVDRVPFESAYVKVVPNEKYGETSSTVQKKGNTSVSLNYLNNKKKLMGKTQTEAHTTSMKRSQPVTSTSEYTSGSDCDKTSDSSHISDTINDSSDKCKVDKHECCSNTVSDQIEPSSTSESFEGAVSDENLLQPKSIPCVSIEGGKAKEVGLLSKDIAPKRGLMSKNLQAVKTLGLDLVEEVRERGKTIRWKGSRLRRAGSFDSEINMTAKNESDSDEETLTRGKTQRLHRRIRRRLRVKDKLNKERSKSMTGSLADLHKDLSYEEATSVHLWVGKDYVNWITRDLYDPHIPFNDTVDRQKTPRMPWHDIAMYVEGPAGRDAARHFIQRWNAIKSEKVKNNDNYPYLIPKSYQPSSFKPSELELKHKVKCQVLRSLGNWSGGITETERSIYNCYVDAIKNAKHFIYIENQFFITCSNNNKNDVMNSVGYHLFDRIVRAHRNKETFRVYVVMPLLPAFEGQIGTPSGIAMQYILHYTYQSIISGPNSLIGMLTSSNVPWQSYLAFCSLRTHDILEGQLVSELIYVHSKLLIVDDRLVIAGSANINDRSLLGDRDSEVCLVIEDEEFTKGLMNGKEYKRGMFCGSLRLYLFNEHLGLPNNSDIDVTDPTCSRFFLQTWQAIASRNTKIYEEVFNCIPSDATTTFAELKILRSKKSLAKMDFEEAKKLLDKIKGRLVLYPLLFLKNEELKPGPSNKEFLLPIQMWV